MAIEVFSNFVNTTLAGTIGPSATSFTVASGTGATLPQPSAGQFGRLIFTDQLTGNVHEIITYTSISGDTVSGVTRGTSPLTWAAGDIILCGPTAQTMAEFVQAGQSQTNGPNYAADTGSANAYAIAPSPAIVGTPAAGTRLYFKAIAANTGASTLSVNGTSYPLTGSNGALGANEIVANGNVTVAWNSTYSGFELVGCTRAEVAVPAATSSGHAINLGQADARYSTAPRGYISGLIMSTAGASTTMSVAAGQATDSTNTTSLNLAASIGKTTSAWSVGSGNGGLDTGSATASAWYHFYLIKRPDTGVVDVVFSLSASAPTLPANYTLFRRIGAGRLNGSSQWTAFIQDGDQFQWLSPVSDVGVVNPGTAAVLRTLSTPPGVRVLANVIVANASVTSNGAFYFSDPSTTDTAPANNIGQVATPSTTTYSQSAIQVRTNTSSQIRSRASFSDGATSMYVTTTGWIDNRGKD